MDYLFTDIRDVVLADPMPCGVRVSRREFKAHFRSVAHVEARALVAELCRRHMRDPSFPMIGRLMNRDHSTVMHLVRLVAHDAGRFARNLAAAEARLSDLYSHVGNDTMQMTLNSTDHLVNFKGIPCRMWTGKSKGGVELYVFIPALQANDKDQQSELMRELLAQPHAAVSPRSDQETFV